MFALAGRASDTHGTRILGSLDPAVEAFNSVSRGFLEWTWNRRAGAGVAVVFLCAALGAAAVLRLRRSAAPILLFLAAIALTSWGQVLLLGRSLTPAGTGFYLAGILCAAALGWVRPMARLPGFPTLPSLSLAREPPKGNAAAPGMPPSEWAIVLAFTLAGLLFRGYALTENPSAFEGETLPMMLGSYTGFGLRYYLTTEFLGTGNGIFHALTHYAFFRLFGASIFTIRLVSVFWGVLAIPLLYLLARRIAGRGAASAAAALFITAPEQLYWSRSDNTFFPPVAVLAIVSAHLCLSLQERFTFRAAAAAALGMVACRYFYTPSWVLFTLPLLLAAHAAFFVRGAFARLRFVAPALLGGLLLWAVGLSVVEYAASAEHQWQLIPAWTVKGESAWKAGIPNEARPAEVLARQAARIAGNAGDVLAGMTRHAKYRTHWYARKHVDAERQTTIAAGLAVLTALGIGYLLGQFRDRRAALLLFWIAIGLLPGCLSDQPEARRISLIFPALPIVAAVFGAAGVRICRQAAGRLGARIAAAAVGVAVAATAWAGLASNALLPTERSRFDVVRRLAEPMLSRCDLVLHNVFAVSNDVVQIGSLDTRIGSGPGRCTEYVHEKDWPVSALDPRCDFSDPVFQLTLPEEEIAARRDGFRPKRIGYLLTAAPESRAHVELLRRLYPSAPVKELPGETPEESLFAMEVPFSEIAALRSPEKSSPPRGARATIEGGLLLTEKDWYRFRLDPECPGAELAAGTPPSSSAQPRPHLAGVHPFAVRLPGAPCPHPLTVRAESALRPRHAIFPLLLAPRALAAARAVPVVAIPGYGDPSLFARLEEPPVDVGADEKGNLFVLTLGRASWTVHRFAPDGREETAFRGDAPPRQGYASLAVDPDGNCLVRVGPAIQIRDRSGKPIHSWRLPSEHSPSDAAFLLDGRIVFCFPGRGSVEVFSRDGRREASLVPSGKPFTAPAGVAVAADGTLAIVEDKGRARVFRNPGRQWAPAEAGSFDVAYPEEPYHPDLASCAFDGTEQILFPHRSLASPLAYDIQGRPLMAAQPQRDLSAKGLKEARGSCSTRAALYVLDLGSSAVIRVARP